MTGWAYSSIVENIYEAAADPDGGGWRRLAPSLARLFDSESCAIAAWNTRSGETTLAVATENYTPALIDEYNTHYRFQDLWLARGASLPRSRAVTGSDLVGDDELQRSEFYNDYLRRLGHMDLLGGIVTAAPGMEAFFSVHRPRERPRFTAENKQSLSVLLPHLTQAVRLYHRLAAVHRGGMIAAAALDALPTAVIAVGADRTLLFANAAAERLLSAGRGLTVSHGRLRLTDRTADAALGPLIGQAAQAAVGRSMGAGGVLPAPRDEGRPLSLRVCPLRPETMAMGPAQPMALVFVGDPDDRRPAPAEMLTRLYGLTPAEARLTQALLAGDTLQDFADRAGVSLHTAKTQLKQVFAKTDTGRQAELVRDLLGNPVLGMGRAVEPKK